MCLSAYHLFRPRFFARYSWASARSRSCSMVSSGVIRVTPKDACDCPQLVSWYSTGRDLKLPVSSNAFKKFTGIIKFSVEKQYRKFFAAVSGAGVIPRHRLTQYISKVSEYLVANNVTESVIDVLEVIKINESNAMMLNADFFCGQHFRILRSSHRLFPNSVNGSFIESSIAAVRHILRS